MLIYTLLGEQAEQAFARGWGVSYGLSAAAEWKVRDSFALALVIKWVSLSNSQTHRFVLRSVCRTS